MAKRLSDSDIWKKAWYRKLPPVYKCFWKYITDNCDHAGIWDVDFELASLFIGGEVDPDKALELFKDHCIALTNSKKWQLIDFISFQYKTFSLKNKAHLSAFNILKKYENQGAIMPRTRGMDGVKVKAMVKDKVKDKELIDKIWDYYIKKTKKQFRLTADKVELIAKKIEEGYTIEQFKFAIDRFCEDDWEGRKNNMDLIYCIGKQRGKQDNFDKWINKEPRKVVFK